MIIVRRVMSGLGSAELLRALNGWKQFVAQTKHTLRVVMAFASSLILRQCRLGFTSWCSAWEASLQRNRALSQLHQALTKLANQGVTRALHAWVSRGTSRRDAFQKINAACTTWRSGALPKAWNSWTTTNRLHRKGAWQAVCSSAMSIGQRRALNTWKSTCEKVFQCTP